MDFISYVENANTIYIVSHQRPDGDAIGSVFGLYYSLKEKYKDKQIYALMSKLPSIFNFISGSDIAVDTVKTNCDLLIVLDSAAWNLVDISEEDMLKCSNIICIDHHMKNTIDADLKILDSMSPAVCEMLYELLDKYNLPVTKQVADFIYLGIMTDTGSFAYSKTSPKTHKIAASLLEKGADFENIATNINETMSEERASLIVHVLQNMSVYCNGMVRVATVSKELADKYKLEEEDISGMASYLRMINGTDLAVYGYEIEEGTYKVSLRSKKIVNCCDLAAHFGGGGHIRAAGFKTHDITKDIEKLIKIVGDVCK